jgi:predicted choloylglycine hydrolase
LGFDLTDPAEQDLQRLLDVPSIPFDGMNEHGLTVGMMAVPSANGFLNSNNPAIGSLMAIRLMLDYTKTLSQALDLLKNYNIDFQGGPAVHYLISDASGKSAIVEYLEEGLMVTWGQNNRQVCTNFIMANEKPEDANSSCWRYNTALSTLNNNEGNLNMSDVMSLLKNVSQSNTIWTTVYNQSTREVFVVMGKKYQEMSTFNLNEIWSQDG